MSSPKSIRIFNASNSGTFKSINFQFLISMRWRWTYVAAGALVLLLLFFLYKKYRVAPEIDFSRIALLDLSGNSVSLEKYTGKPLVLSFAASWCGPCLKELKELEQVKAEVLPVANILVVSDESPEQIARLRGQGNLSFDFLKLAGRFAAIGIHSIPTTYLLDSQGKVVKEEVGLIRWSDAGNRMHLLKLMEE